MLARITGPALPWSADTLTFEWLFDLARGGEEGEGCAAHE
jgi:hypothetical protein